MCSKSLTRCVYANNNCCNKSSTYAKKKRMVTEWNWLCYNNGAAGIRDKFGPIFYSTSMSIIPSFSWWWWCMVMIMILCHSKSRTVNNIRPSHHDQKVCESPRRHWFSASSYHKEVSSHWCICVTSNKEPHPQINHVNIKLHHDNSVRNTSSSLCQSSSMQYVICIYAYLHSSCTIITALNHTYCNNMQ